MNFCGVNQMNDKEERAFRLAIVFYQKWRETILETDEQWDAFAEDVGKYAAEADVNNCILAENLLYALTKTFSVLYHGGAKPLPTNYAGRSDI